MADEEEWEKIGSHILMELKRLNKTCHEMTEQIANIHKDDIPNLKIEVAMLKVKAGIWGLMGGAIPLVITILLKYFSDSS